MVVVDQEEVVEVPTHLLGRGHGGVDVELLAAWEGREDAGQHVRLDLRGDVELRPDALFLGGDGGQVLDVVLQGGRHVVEALGQVADLVVIVDLGAVVQIAAADHLHVLLQGGDGVGEPGGKFPRRDADQGDDGGEGREEQQHRDDDVALHGPDRSQDHGFRDADAKGPAGAPDRGLRVVDPVPQGDPGRFALDLIPGDASLSSCCQACKVKARGFEPPRPDGVVRPVQQEGLGPLQQVELHDGAVQVGNQDVHADHPGELAPGVIERGRAADGRPPVVDVHVDVRKADAARLLRPAVPGGLEVIVIVLRLALLHGEGAVVVGDHEAALRPDVHRRDDAAVRRDHRLPYLLQIAQQVELVLNVGKRDVFADEGALHDVDAGVLFV